MSNMNKKNIKIKISDITADSTLSVIANLEGKKIELPTKYASLTAEERQELVEIFGEKFLPLENILKLWQDRLREVGFKGTLSKLELIAITNDGVFRWDNVKISKHVLTNGRSLHVVIVKLLEGERYNRRRGIRINIDKAMKLEQEGKLYSVIVRDLSYCGMAFAETSENQINPTMPFVLHLTDNDEDGKELLVSKIKGKVHNQKATEKGEILYGCVIAPEHAAFLQKYVATKQIEAIRGARLGKKLQKTMTGEFWQEDMAEALKNNI